VRGRRPWLLWGGIAALAYWAWARTRAAVPAGASPQTGQPTVIQVPRSLNPCPGCQGASGMMQWVSGTQVAIASPSGAGMAGPTGQWRCVCGGS
jgi:hypothetical protein